MRVHPYVQAALQAIKATTPDPIPESLICTQNTKFQCLFIKRRKPDGDTCQVVIGPSLLRWLLVIFLVVVWLFQGGNPTQLLWSFLHP
jgi:hypothetical protein